MRYHREIPLALFAQTLPSAEEVADRVLFDLLRGFNPYSQGQYRQPDHAQVDRDDRISNGVRHQFAGDRGDTKADRVDYSTERMSPSERSATLASDTADMDHKRQIFLRDGSGLAASGRDRSDTKRSANGHRH